MHRNELKNITQKELILRLIRDSLINHKLISGLNDLGLQAGDYTTFLSDTIFLLMDLNGHQKSDFIFENIYMAYAQKVKYIDFSSSTEELDILSKEIYMELLFARSAYEL